MVSQHPPKLGGHTHCGCEDIMVLVGHVISQDHVIKGTCDFTGRRLSRQVTILSSLETIGIVVTEIQ